MKSPRFASFLPVGAVFGVMFGVSAIAQAGEPDSVDADNPTPHVYMGQPVAPCGWPTVPAVTSGGGLCTGTLVHPRVVVYAAHCGGGGKVVRFSESAFNGGNAIGASCQTNPGYDNSQGTDWAFCVLDQAVDQLPLAPIVMGCELDTLVAQQEVAVVGFGKNTPNGGSGTKRWANTILQAVNIPGNTTSLGGGGDPSICPGDSGGPAFIKGDDGIWRVFGIASTVNLMGDSDCGGLGTHALIAGAVPWIEEASGFDITPCHDADGTWNPGPDCTGFFGSANNSYGSWGNWCSGTPSSGAPATCGPPTGSVPEQNPPSVSISSPSSFESSDVPTIFDIAISASDDSGFLDVWLRINDEDILNVIDSSPPYQVNNVTLPEGGYEIRAVAEDYYGNQAVSAPITVVVGAGEPPTTTGDGGDDGGGDGDGDGGTSGDGGLTSGGLSGGFDGGGFDDGGGDQGCACTSASPESPAGALGFGVLALFGLGLATRRRS